jgi:YVTN family beta-propeller protein
VALGKSWRAILSVAGAASLLVGVAMALTPASAAASSTYAVTEVPIAATLVDGVAADPATNTVYADVSVQPYAIAVINGATDAVTAQINLPFEPGVVAVDSASDTVYAISYAAASPTAAVINGATNTVTATISLPAGLRPYAAVVNPVTHMVYVTDWGNGTVVVIDGNTDTVAAIIPLADPVLDPKPFPRGADVDSATNTVYVGDAGGDQVEVIDGATNAITGRIPLPSGSYPAGIAADPAAGLVYVADQDTGAISVINTATDGVSTLVSGMQLPLALGLDAASGTLFAASRQGGTAGLGTTYVIDTATGALVAQIPRGATSVTVTPAGGGSAYLTNGRIAGPLEGYVTVITPSTVNTMSPVILSDALSGFAVGQSGEFQLTASATPSPTFSATGLPAGLTLSPSGLLSGTPAPGTGGQYPIPITAVNGIAPSFTETFYLSVDAAPVITSAGQVTFTAGVASTFSATASGYPASGFTETGALPVGVAFSPSGVLSGTPTAPGVYPIQITASNGVGAAATQAFTLVVEAPPSMYIPVGPVRVLDTRNGTGGYSSPVGQDGTISLQVTGVDGVPSSGVTAVVLNVTATDPTASSYVTVYPDSTSRPTASDLNFTAGETIANLVTVPVGADGLVDFYNYAGSTDLVADLEGYYTSAGSAYDSAGPVRILDTRNGTGGYTTPVGPGGTIGLQVDGVAGVPSTGVTAVALNVTATNPTASSYVTVYPDGAARPTASNLNFTAGETIPNLVIVPVGADGKVDFYNFAGSVNLVADLAGYYTSSGSGSEFVALGPVRVLDTRNGTGGYSSAVGPGQTISLPVTGVDGVSGVTAVVLNVTATSPTASSYVTVYPDGVSRPTASNLNFTPGETIPNLVVVPVGADGDVDFYNNTGSVELVADLEGYFVS